MRALFFVVQPGRPSAVEIAGPMAAAQKAKKSVALKIQIVSKNRHPWRLDVAQEAGAHGALCSAGAKRWTVGAGRLLPVALRGTHPLLLLFQ